MNSWKIILAVVVIFGAGVMTGALLVNHVDHSTYRPPENVQRPQEYREHAEAPLPPEPPIVRQMNKDFLKKLDNKLKLSPEQHSKIEKIIAEGQERNHEIWRTNAGPLMRAVMMDVTRQIRGQLRPEQQKDFEELLKKFHPARRQNTNAPPVLPTTNAPAAATNAPGV
jgi:Spy/CpxP family protein refolding chaperone